MDELYEQFENIGYEIDENIGADSWGDLFLARYTPHGSRVLLRVFPGSLGSDAAAWELASAEIQSWARIDHPGVLKVYDWEKAAPRPYAVTEAPPGTRLGELLEGRGLPAEPETVFFNLLAAVEAARQWGVLHLELGTHNIWVAGDGTVKVGDFGLWYLRREFPALGLPGQLFAAPEQRRAERVNAGTDVYLLGAIFIALRCGLEAALESMEGEAVPAGLGEYRPVVARCLETVPLARYRSAGEVARELGWTEAGLPHPGYRDCPICRLKDELQIGVEGAPRAGSRRRRPRGGQHLSVMPWAVIAILFTAAFILWWMALR